MSTFMKPNVSISSFSHSMTRRFSIAAGSTGTRSSSRSRVRTKPPGCWLRWRGVPISWRARSRARARRGSVRSRFSSSTWRSGTPSFDQPQIWLGKRAGHVLGQAQRLADLADRAPAAIAADHRGQGGMALAIAVVDPLDHLLAPLMLEIDVDVGRLGALAGDEALEQELVLDRIDRGDAEHVADHRIGGRAPALAQYPLASRKSDDRVHRQEIRRIIRAIRPASAHARGSSDNFRARRPGIWRRAPRGSAFRAHPAGVRPDMMISSGYW